MSTVPFGREFRKKYFANEAESLRNVNHGSFGVSPDIILQKYIDDFLASRKTFDHNLRYNHRDQYIEATKILAGADLLDCDHKNLVFADSGSAGVTHILRSFPFNKGDKIILTSTTYGTCSAAVRFLEARVGIVPVIVNLTYPLTQDEIVQKFKSAIESEGPIRLGLIDAVSSLPGARLPFEDIVEVLKENKIVSLVDSSHGIGLIPNLSLSKLGADFFVTNLHKWWYIPKSSSVIYVDPKYHGVIEATSISYSYSTKTDYIKTEEEVALRTEFDTFQLIDKFWFTGYQNRSNICIVKDVKAFRDDVCGGELAIAKYCSDLAFQIQDTVWADSNNKFPADKEAVTAMINIRIPVEKWDLGVDKATIAKWLSQVSKTISTKHNTYVQLFSHNGEIWVRFSTQIYNDIDDYIFAANAIESEFKKFFKNVDKYALAPKSGNLFEVVTGLEQLGLE